MKLEEGIYKLLLYYITLKLRLSIIGCGYVGIVTGVCLANSGHNVYIYDKDRQKISNFKAGKI